MMDGYDLRELSFLLCWGCLMVKVKGFCVHMSTYLLGFAFWIWISQVLRLLGSGEGVADRVIFSNGENIMCIAGDPYVEFSGLSTVPGRLIGADGWMHFFGASGSFLVFGLFEGKGGRILCCGYRMGLGFSSHGDCRGKDGRRGRGNGKLLLGMSGDNEGSFFIACVHPI